MVRHALHYYPPIVHSAPEFYLGECAGKHTALCDKEFIMRRKRRRRKAKTRAKPPNNWGFRAMPYASCLQDILFECVGNGRAF